MALYFNTSNVIVQPDKLPDKCPLPADFNTSNVIVQRSFHGCRRCTAPFQYIKCDCSAKWLVLIIIPHVQFQYIKCDCSAKACHMFLLRCRPFQYIKCDCSALHFLLTSISLNKFQYIKCDCSARTHTKHYVIIAYFNTSNVIVQHNKRRFAEWITYISIHQM